MKTIDEVEERDTSKDEDVCPGWCEDCEYCMYYHDPCFPEFEDEEGVDE